MTFNKLIVPMILSAPMLHAQHNVHAPLLAVADRKPAPAFRLTDNTNHSAKVSSYRGKVVLLNFWATQCGGCVLEIPFFIDIQKTHKNDRFQAVGISIDIPYENLKNADEAWSRVKPFILSHQINYQILMGDQAVSDKFGLQAYPATFLLDKRGRIAATYVGVVNKQDVEDNINKLLLER